MFPIILERDTPIIDWTARLSGWPTSSAAAASEVFEMRSDGLLKVDYGTMDVANVSGPTTGECECCGLYITGPEALDEFTPYAISAVAMSEDALIRPFLFIGMAPATITSDAGGDALTICRVIGVADLVDAQGACLEIDRTIIVKEMPTAGRALAVGVGMMAGIGNSANVHCWARLSVRRLVGNNPAIIDTRKL